MIGKKVELHMEYVRDYLYSKEDEKVYAIILDKIRNINKYDTYEGNCSHSTNYIYLTTDYYLIELLDGENEKVNWSIIHYGNIRQVKPSLIKSII